MVGALAHDDGIEASKSAADGAGGRRRPADGRVPTGRQRLQPAGDHPRAALRAAVCVGPAEAVCTTPNAGKPWTEADEAALMQMFDVGCSMEEMQARFQRTNGAIVRRLERLGRLRPGETMK